MPDLTKDRRFKDLPIVIGEPYIRFYCGMPLINREGYALGSYAWSISRRTRSARRSVKPSAASPSRPWLSWKCAANFSSGMSSLGGLEAKAAAEAARERSDVLLRNTLPAPIAEELKTQDRVRPRYHEAATVLFADFKGSRA